MLVKITLPCSVWGIFLMRPLTLTNRDPFSFMQVMKEPFQHSMITQVSWWMFWLQHSMLPSFLVSIDTMVSQSHSETNLSHSTLHIWNTWTSSRSLWTTSISLRASRPIIAMITSMEQIWPLQFIPSVDLMVVCLQLGWEWSIQLISRELLHPVPQSFGSRERLTQVSLPKLPVTSFSTSQAKNATITKRWASGISTKPHTKQALSNS